MRKTGESDKNISLLQYVFATVFRLMALFINYIPSFRAYLKTRFGFLNFTAGYRTANGSMGIGIRFCDGRMKVLGRYPDNADTSTTFRDDKTAYATLTAPMSDIMHMVLANKIILEGNMNYNFLFMFIQSLFRSDSQIRSMKKAIKMKESRLKKESAGKETHSGKFDARKKSLIKGRNTEPGVEYLQDPYLSGYSLDDFPRVRKFLDIHLTTIPEICPERPRLMTDWFVENGFETDKNGKPWEPVLRQAYAMKYLMENKKPKIRKDDLLAGTTTSNENNGVVIFPEARGLAIWPELFTAEHREIYPYKITDETMKILHFEVFPFWINRTFSEWVRQKYRNPLSQRIEERFAVFFHFKTLAISHFIADFPKVIRVGAGGIINEIDNELSTLDASNTARKNNLTAMRLCLEGLIAYARNLSLEAARQAAEEKNTGRKKELELLAGIFAKVPERPAETLDEAINAIWVTWIMIHMENTDAGLSLGRLDQWLQPYFLSDIRKIASVEGREEYIRHAIEMIGCFYLRCNDKLNLYPEIGNFLFGGASGEQAITLGGITPEGNDAVNDMTYIFLKVTEMLSTRSPNVNARYNREKNSDIYLKRLCDVNFITSASPSMHGDETVMKSLEEFNYETADLRDWAATGCVEPSICGRHVGHTNCMMMNMVAALEMAMNNGKHPLMDWDLGPKTGSIENGDFRRFDEFFTAFETQYRFLIDQSVEYNNMLGEAHAYIRPTPFVSSIMDGCIRKGKDITSGGAKYNTSGAACIGLADVTDSMMAIKKLVFNGGKVSFGSLKEAVDGNFENNRTLHSIITKQVPFFGSGSDEAIAMANRIAKLTHDVYFAHQNFRGGRYTAGFWSMANHVAFGTLSGAIPSGRLAGKAFTPGLTPQSIASKNLLDNIRDVARLDPRNMNNNMAFNVKVVPSMHDSHGQTVDNIYSYVKTYFELGGMQLQLNVVTSDMLRDAMAHPENYRNLLVRISGYNAYFVTLNSDMQQELIERAEYCV